MKIDKYNCKQKNKLFASSIITSTAVLLGLYINNPNMVKADSLSTNRDISQDSNQVISSNDTNNQNENSGTQDEAANTTQTSISSSETVAESDQPASQTNDLTRSLKNYTWNGINVTFDDTAGVLTIPGGTEDNPLVLNNPNRIFSNLNGGAFSYDQIKEIRFTGKIKIIGSAAKLFSYFKGLTTISGLDQLDTSEVTNMSYMFSDNPLLTNIDVSHFKTDNVTDMSFMFDRCYKLTDLAIGQFKTNKVTNMSYMFYGSSGLTSLDVTKWNTSEVTDMSHMFGGCSGLTSLDVTLLDTSKVTNISGMFSGCSGLTDLDVTLLDTSKVTNISGMFSGCSGLTDLDVTHLVTRSVTDMSDMFRNCKNLTSVDVSHFDTSNVTNMSAMFDGCTSLRSLDLKNFDTSNVKQMYYMFRNCKNLTSVDVSRFNTGKVLSMMEMFKGCQSLTSVDVTHFDTSATKYIFNMFSECQSLTKLDLSNFDMSNVLVNRQMLYGLKSLKILVLGPKCDISFALSTGERLNKWINLGGGTLINAKGNNVWTSEELGVNYYGAVDADTYIWFGTVKAHYRDENGNEIASDQELRGLIGEDYTSLTKINIPGYDFKEVQGEDNGIYEDTPPKEVTYIYIKRPYSPVVRSKVTVHYQDEDGNKITTDEVLTGKVGDGYQTIQKSIAGYTFKEVRGDAVGFFSNNDQTVTYIYTKDDDNIIATLPVKHNKSKLKKQHQQTAVKAALANTADPLPQTGASKENSNFIVVLGSMMLLISSLGGIWLKRRKK